jgi:hypothetical protein
MNRVAKMLSRASYATAASIGAAAGAGNRARTMRSKREKANDPRRQRKDRHWLRGE